MARLLLSVAGLSLIMLLGVADDARKLSPERVSKSGIPIIYGHGDTITELGTVPPKAEESLPGIPKNVSIGYKYSRFHIYYADLWTWNGSHVLYSGNKYWNLDDSAWTRLLGATPEKKFGRPFLYRFPLGLILVSSVAVVCGVYPIVCPSVEKRLAKLSKNPQYMSALEALFPPDKYPLQTNYDEGNFETAVSTLTAQGISDAKARDNLQLLAAAITVSRTGRIETAVESAQALSSQGSYDEGISILEEVLKELPATDPYYSAVTEVLTDLRKLKTQPADLTSADAAAESTPAG